jgi:phage gpG-like protein
MPASIRISIVGDKKIIKKLNKFSDQLLNFRVELGEIGKDLLEFYSNQVFTSQGIALVGKWKKLNEQYRNRKGREFPGAGILQREGTMRRSFQRTTTRNALTIFNETDYFKYHQSSEPRTKLPRRQMIGITNEKKRVIVDILQSGLQKRINAFNTKL